ncbi:MAG: BUG/TctC family periplasmic protein, partial [uncultured Acetobacteraceae bacterium]
GANRGVHAARGAFGSGGRGISALYPPGAGSLPDPPRHHHRAVGTRRLDGHPGPRRRGTLAAVPRPARRGREPLRRVRQRGIRRRGARPAGRPHPAVRLHEHARDERRAVPRHALRRRGGLHRHLAPRLRAEHHGGAPVGAGEHGGGVHRPRQSQPGQGRLRLGRRRVHQPPLRGDVRAHDGHRDGARPLPRRRAGGAGHGRRPDATPLQRRHADPRAREGRAPQAARRHRRTALAAAPGGADRGGNGAGLRDGRLVRRPRSEGHASGPRCPPQRRDQPRPPAAGGARQDGRDRRRGRQRDARGLRRRAARGRREVGQGDPRTRHHHVRHV